MTEVVFMEGNKYRPAGRDHKHLADDILPADVIPTDITSRIPQITRGTLSVFREANKVIFTLYDVRFENETEFPEFFYLDDAIPIGCRPAESYVSFLGMYDVTGAKSRRVRFQKDRRILLYDLAVGDRVNLVATFYTDEPPVDII